MDRMKPCMYKVYMAAILFLIVGGIAWGWMAINGKNIVSKTFGKWAGLVYGLVGLSALLMLAFGRDAFLPFLGASIVPCSVLQDKVPEGADTTVSVSVRPGAKVLYWAAEPANEGLKVIQSWREAYGSLDNAGVATANGDGVALLKFRKPQMYTVAFHGALQPHVHYRECGDNGWMAPVENHFLTEGFQESEMPQEPTPAEEQMPMPTEEPMPVPLEEPVPIEPEQQEQQEQQEQPVDDVSLLPPPNDNSTELEGFSPEPLMAAANDIGTTLASHHIDPRLQELKQHVQQSSTELIDSNIMGFAEHIAFGGTELDAAFAPPEVHPIPPAV